MHRFFKPHGIALVLALAFVVAAYFALLAYGRYANQWAEVERTQARVQQLQRQKAELERKKRTLLKVNQFMGEVRALGLAKKDWTFYNVNIEEPATFYEIQQIIGQTTHATGYYFKALGLNIRTTLETDTDSEGALVSEPVPVAEGREQGDLLLKLKGAFIARHN